MKGRLKQLTGALLALLLCVSLCAPAAAVEKSDAEIDTESSLRYREDFDLGDVCTVKDDRHGIICQKRITECEEVYENGTFSLSVVFGEGYLLLPKYLERKLK